jgi:hypothetical protein
MNLKMLKEIYNIEITESYYGMIEQGVRTPKLFSIILTTDNYFLGIFIEITLSLN